MYLSCQTDAVFWGGQATHLHATFQLPIDGVLVLDDPMKLGAELV